MNAPRRPHLTGPEREVLAGLLAEHPGASCGQVAKWFESRAGRPVSRASVHAHKAAPSRVRKFREHLTPEQSDLLDGLIRQAGPEGSRTEIAAEFRALSGRGLVLSVVSQRARDRFGYPRLPNGPRPGQGCPDAALAARIAGASAAKREGIKVDRSVRIGHAGRIDGSQGRAE